MVNLTRISLGLILVLGVLLSIQTCRLSDRDAKIAADTLKDLGWTLSQGKPKVDDVPAGSRPVAVVEGGVRYLPRSRQSSGGAGSPSPASDIPPTFPPTSPPGTLVCNLDSLTVDLRCRAEIVEVAGVTAAKLWTRGTILSLDGAKRELPERLVGVQTVDEAQPIETERPRVEIQLPRKVPYRWYSARVGVLVPHGGWTAGGSIGKGPWGVWADYRKRPGDDEIGVGVEIRF